jgi:hypothetical protein
VYSISHGLGCGRRSTAQKTLGRRTGAAQIARRLGYSRNAVCAKLTRLDLKRGHKPPTAKPKIRPRAIRQAEVGAARAMIERTEQRFAIKPERLAGDTAYGSGANLDWLVNQAKITPLGSGANTAIECRTASNDYRLGASQTLLTRCLPYER